MEPNVSWISPFLLGLDAVFLVVFALPFLFCPLRWGAWFQWPIPPGRNELAVYFGRCLGVVALAVLVLLYRAARDPVLQPVALDLVVCIGSLMVAVHIWGALRRMQPWTETVEIGVYAVVTVLAGWLRTLLP